MGFQPQSHHLSELKDDAEWLFVIILHGRCVMGQGDVPHAQGGLGSDWGDMSSIQTAQTCMGWASVRSLCLVTTFHSPPDCSQGFTQLSMHGPALWLLLLIGVTWAIIIIRWKMRLMPSPGLCCCSLAEARPFPICQVRSAQESVNQ